MILWREFVLIIISMEIYPFTTLCYTRICRPNQQYTLNWSKNGKLRIPIWSIRYPTVSCSLFSGKTKFLFTVTDIIFLDIVIRITTASASWTLPIRAFRWKMVKFLRINISRRGHRGIEPTLSQSHMAHPCSQPWFPLYALMCSWTCILPT